MKLFIKAFRNGLGALIALVSRLIPVSKVKRDAKAQVLADEIQRQNEATYEVQGIRERLLARRAKVPA